MGEDRFLRNGQLDDRLETVGRDALDPGRIPSALAKADLNCVFCFRQIEQENDLFERAQGALSLELDGLRYLRDILGKRLLECLQAGFDDCPSITLDIVRTFGDAGPSTIRCLLDNVRQTYEQLLQMAPAGRGFFLDLRATRLLREHAFFDSKDVGGEPHGEAQELNEVDPKRR